MIEVAFAIAVVLAELAAVYLMLKPYFKRTVALEERVARVTQQLTEAISLQSEALEKKDEWLQALKSQCQHLVGDSQALIAQASQRVTDARNAYSDGQMLRDNALRRIEKWNEAIAPLVQAMDKFKDKVERQQAQLRKDLDAVISAQAASAGMLTKRVKKIEAEHVAQNLGKVAEMDSNK